jgi:micrococcal nuclease
MAGRFRRMRPERWLILLALLVFVLWRAWQAPELPPQGHLLEPGEYRVRRVVDGDTLLLENGVRVRLIGVDTPETVHPDRPPEPGGQEASDYTRRAVEGRYVTLSFDRERLDRFDRHLAYVTINGRLLNEELIREGYGRATLQYNYSGSMKARFRTAQEHAQQKRLGIWAQPLERVPMH